MYPAFFDAVGHMGGSPPICITSSDSSSNIFFPHAHAPGLGLGGLGGLLHPDALSAAGGTGGAGGSMQLYSEMEALQLSRSDNPFVRQSQDNLDAISLARKVPALFALKERITH